MTTEKANPVRKEQTSTDVGQDPLLLEHVQDQQDVDNVSQRFLEIARRVERLEQKYLYGDGAGVTRGGSSPFDIRQSLEDGHKIRYEVSGQHKLRPNDATYSRKRLHSRSSPQQAEFPREAKRLRLQGPPTVRQRHGRLDLGMQVVEAAHSCVELLAYDVAA